MSKQCKCGSWAVNDFPDSGLCDKCYWKKLVEEAPKFFAPEHAFNGEKLKWLKRAGLVTSNVELTGSPASGESV